MIIIACCLHFVAHLFYVVVVQTVYDHMFYVQQKLMGDYTITKVMDGLFISDSIVPNDYFFLQGNKIIRMLGWSNYHDPHYYPPQHIEEMILTKNVTEVRFPTFSQLKEAFQFMAHIHEELLCGLIYSDTQLQAALIAVMYLMYRFSWNMRSAFAYMKSKIESFDFSQKALEELQLFEDALSTESEIELSSIIWDYDFLTNYQPKSDEEKLLITTFKNKLRPKELEESDKAKKKGRIRWWDQVRPGSAMIMTKSTGKTRSSITKYKIGTPFSQMFPNNSDIRPKQSQTFAQQNTPIRATSAKKHINRADRQNIQLEEDAEYIQLKEMSRTNFNDRKFMTSKLRRRGSLKPKKEPVLTKSQSSGALVPQTFSLQSITSIVDIYSQQAGKSSLGKKSYSKAAAGQMFLSGLRSQNKLSLNHA